MTPEDIKDVVLSPSDINSAETPLLANTIPGATPILHNITANSTKTFAASTDILRVFFLVNGEADFITNGRTIAYDEPAVFATYPQDGVSINATKNSIVLEIQWLLTELESSEMLSNPDLPFTQKYSESQKYRDPFKSEKTISRAVVPHRILPRFAMGTVETYGTDLIGQHAHPLLDQFFFSFPENDCILLIDSMQYPMKGTTMLHIPLGSNHGVFTGENHCAHYLWIDFIPDESGLEYLDQVHKAV